MIGDGVAAIRGLKVKALAAAQSTVVVELCAGMVPGRKPSSDSVLKGGVGGGEQVRAGDRFDDLYVVQ